jgi:hypothetical protein
VVIVTSDRVEDLPYDLWYEGRRVTLALGTFFPNLAVPVVRELTPDQRARLAIAPEPALPLGRERTCDHVLRHVFEIDVSELVRPAALVAWLNRRYARHEPLPPALATYLLDRLSPEPAYAGWPLERLLRTPDAIAEFMREQWRGYLQRETGTLLAEAPAAYIVDFADAAVQDGLAGLVRTGAVRPLGVGRFDALPAWAKPGVVDTDVEANERRRIALTEELAERVADLSPETSWATWQALARDWAELRVLSNDATTSTRLADRIGPAFDAWLVARYSPLSNQKLPIPHHVHHVPHYLARERRTGAQQRVALLVLDGMSLRDWHVIERTWRARHTDWQVETRLLLAQIPTITSNSRQALISGLRPAEFADTLDSTGREPRRWLAFWAREDLSPAQCAYRALAFDQNPEPELPGPEVQALCLVDVSIDELIHGATAGDAGFRASLEVWLSRYSPNLERFLTSLLAEGFTVFVASDHGHVEARGIGMINDGLAAELKAKRARVYRERVVAERVQSTYDGARIWAVDGILPDGLWAVLPTEHTAFTTMRDLVVTHGGASLDEVVVPFATITLE